MSEREALGRLIVEHNPDDMHPDDQRRCLCGAQVGTSDGLVVTTDPYGHLIEEIIAAGFRRTPAPQQVSTVAELAALPVGSVIRDDVPSGGVRIAEKYNDGGFPWRFAGSWPSWMDADVHLPATVLYRSEGGESDPVAASNARQSEFYRRADEAGTNDRADVTSGSGMSAYEKGAIQK